MADAALRAALPSALRRRAVSGTGVGLALAVATVAAGATSAEAQDYTVQPGDTVSHISLRTSATVAQIVAANGLDARAQILAGQRLVIPAAGAPAAAAAPAPVAAAVPATSHTVVRGDTVSAVATRYGSTTAAIISMNGLAASALIRIGQVLTIPSAGTAPAVPSALSKLAGPPPAPATTATHTVTRGDTVSGLATRYGTTTAAIVAANGLPASALIRIGQVLTLSGAAATPAAAPAGLVGNTFAGRTYPAATVDSANQNKATLLEMGVPSTAEMRSLVITTARDMGVDPALAQAVAFQESGFNHASVSPANAIGAMQVIPTSGQWAGDLVGRPLNLLDPRDNVVAGVAILGRLVATSADLPTAIAGYYQGQAGVKKHGMYPDTRRYVANVQTLMSRFA